MADLRIREGWQEFMDDEHPGPIFERRQEWAGVLDVPLLLLEGLAGLPVDKLPPPESLSSLGVAIVGGPGRDAPAQSVICASFHAARLLSEVRQGVVNPVFSVFRPLLASTKGDWDSVARQIMGVTRAHLLAIRDFLRMLANALVLPYVLRVNEVRDGENIEAEILSSTLTQMALILAARWHIGTFLRHSLDWHKTLGIAAGTGEVGGSYNYAWPPWFAQVKAANGVIIEPLCSSAALQEEGARMHHCAGGYDRECMTGRTQIFSLRTAKGKRLSTLQLSMRGIRPGVYRFTDEQNLAAYNGRPPPEAQAAAKELLAALNKGNLRHNVAAALVPQVHADTLSLCGFDYRSDTAWQQARAAAIPFLPSDLKRLGAMEFGAFVTAFTLKPRSEQPELDEPDDDHEDFEKRVLRWIR